MSRVRYGGIIPVARVGALRLAVRVAVFVWSRPHLFRSRRSPLGRIAAMIGKRRNASRAVGHHAQGRRASNASRERRQRTARSIIDAVHGRSGDAAALFAAERIGRARSAQYPVAEGDPGHAGAIQRALLALTAHVKRRLRQHCSVSRATATRRGNNQCVTGCTRALGRRCRQR